MLTKEQREAMRELGLLDLKSVDDVVFHLVVEVVRLRQELTRVETQGRKVEIKMRQDARDGRGIAKDLRQRERG